MQQAKQGRHGLGREQGGTLLGMIIGLVIGLGIALGVAVMITKTPLPFSPKPARQDRPDPGAANDPNKPLYGKVVPPKEVPARENARAESPAPAKPPVAQAPAVPVTPAASATTATTAATQRDASKLPPVVDMSASDKKKTEARAMEPKPTDMRESIARPTGDDKWTYFLQAGAFRDQADAENTRAKLALMGVEARVSERQSENGTLYRVRVGPFGEMETLNKAKGKLSDNGVDAAVVRIAKQ